MANLLPGGGVGSAPGVNAPRRLRRFLSRLAPGADALTASLERGGSSDKLQSSGGRGEIGVRFAVVVRGQSGERGRLDPEGVGQLVDDRRRGGMAIALDEAHVRGRHTRCGGQLLLGQTPLLPQRAQGGAQRSMTYALSSLP